MFGLYTDPRLTDEQRRTLIYQGHLFLLSPTSASMALCDFAEEVIRDAFAGHDPQTAQFDMPVEDFVAIVAPLQPRFIHHPHTKELIVDMLRDAGCDMEQTYFDVPRLRVMSSSGYLTSGVGYELHPHRDTWYSAPQSQLNWWLPIFEIDARSAMAFLPRYWEQPLANGSSSFNYYDWNSRGRKDAASQIKEDTREQPKPLEKVIMEPDVRPIPTRAGTILFSGAHLHATVPNTSGVTRFSIDFRTVNKVDVLMRRGAPNIDSACTGTSLRDFMRCSDLQRMEESQIAAFDTGSLPEHGVLVYSPSRT